METKLQSLPQNMVKKMEIEISNYQEAVEFFGTEVTHRPKVIVMSDRIITNDMSHGPHDENNLDDGSTSQFALDLAHRLEALGFETEVSRLE